MKKASQTRCLTFAPTDAGYAHWVTANRLAETADNVTEYVLIASELEAVVNSDPQFKDSYMKLVHLYEKIAMEQGGACVFKGRPTS